MRNVRRIATVLVSGALLCCGVRLSRAADKPGEASKEGVEFFEKNVRPVLSESCWKCHSVQAKKVKGKLYLDSWEAMAKGGESGKPAVVPGKPDESMLNKSIHYGYKGDDEDLNMPPAKDGKSHKLPDDVIAKFDEWVKMGAPHPTTFDKPPAPKAEGPQAPLGGTTPTAVAAPSGDGRGGHWAFRAPVAAPAPVVKTAGWARTDLDKFVLAKLEAVGLAPSPAADRRTLVRRATFDLTGLPPTPEDVAAFESDHSPNAFEKVVDRLLASPAYGERWGRHWLDVARYADTRGYLAGGEDRNYPFAYTYRDWVIGAFNRDLPYDQFIVQQIAADKLDLRGDTQPLAAMGFLTVGRRFLNSQPDIIDDRIDVVTRGTMGLTVVCARCHDHKFDPISAKDYYGLYGVFASSVEPKDLPSLAAAASTPASLAFEKELKAREAAVESFVQGKSAEIVNAARSAKGLPEYLMLTTQKPADRGGGEPPVPGEPNRVLVRKWREYLAAAAASKELVFAAWRAYAALPADGFAEKAKPLTEQLITKGAAGKPIHPLVAAAFKDKPPASMRDVAGRYAELLARFDKPEKATDANEESLRLVLRGPDSPVAISVEDTKRLFNRADREHVIALQKKVEEWHASAGAPPRAMVMNDAPNPHDANVLLRGNPGSPGPVTPRRFLSILGGDDAKRFTQGSGRLELAKAIASRDNPLTARVMVNRVWGWHFGAALVRTPSDFGVRSDPPANPQLLDWLAVRFMDDPSTSSGQGCGWSIKKLHKLVMTSAAYQQASDDRPAARAIDPENALIWRFNRQRLDYEETRDALVAVTGRLDSAMGGQAIDPTKPDVTRRAVYGSIDRQNLPGLFRAFDFASPDAHAPQRFNTTVPQQALFFMNSPFVQLQAKRVTERPELAGATTDLSARIQKLHRLLYGRDATADEVALGRQFIESADDEKAAPPATWQYGYGHYDESSKRVIAFTPLPHFTGQAYQGGPKLPDPKLGYATLNAKGGHPGDNPGYAVIRRWTAPAAGTVQIDGTLEHPDANGDGVRGRIVTGRGGLAGEFVAAHAKVETPIASVRVAAGETIDFVVDCQGGTLCDGFAWSPTIHLDAATASKLPAGERTTWGAAGDFAGPTPKAEAPSAWEKYVQVLLESNEFVFVD